MIGELFLLCFSVSLYWSIVISMLVSTTIIIVVIIVIIIVVAIIPIPPIPTPKQLIQRGKLRLILGITLHLSPTIIIHE